jgi:lipopolysaccharide transport system ATP-binding protein
MSEEFAIRLRGVGKSYRRFTSPIWQAAALLGCPVPARRFDVFWALNDISFDVRRGERVGLIGRNGAGKSTLLRIIAGQLVPTCGEVSVNGAIQALMELGTGFHPEFNALQNIRTALALNGFTGREMAAKIDDVVEFTELDEFLERPLREYSAGMYARLAFAVATTIKPSVLIIDEILGAGDAYFVGKCTQRIRDLTNSGATVLFVSHDLGSVQMICDRAIWLHRGKLCADGGSLAIGKQYQAHIREEEEIRLRARTMSLSRRQSAAIVGSRHSETTTLYRLIGPGGTVPHHPCYIHEIRYGADERTVGTIAVGGNDTEGDGRLLVDPGKLNWSKATIQAARRCRAFSDYGGTYRHAPFLITWPAGLPGGRWLEFELVPSASQSINLDEYCALAQDYRTLQMIAPDPSQQWRTIRVNLPDPVDLPETQSEHAAEENALPSPEDTLDPAPDNPDNDDELPDAPDEGAVATAPAATLVTAPRWSGPDRNERYGSGEITITEFAVYDATGTRRHTVISGEPITASLSYYAAEPVIDPVAVIAIYLPDGNCAMQLISRRDDVEFGRILGYGSFTVDLDPLLLGPGDYVVSVALFKDIDLRSGAEPPAYDLHDRAYLLRVLPPDGIRCTIGVVNQRGLWRVSSLNQVGSDVLQARINERNLL